MEELTKTEFLFIKKMDELIGLGSPDGIEIEEGLDRLYRRDSSLYYRIKGELTTLIEKEVFVSSPDGTRVKLTDFGSQLFTQKLREEEEWVNQGPFIKLNPARKEEIDIKKGEHFKG